MCHHLVHRRLADGTSLAHLAITGKLPVNEFSPGVGGPAIGTITQSSTGGSIPGGVTFRIALCASVPRPRHFSASEFQQIWAISGPSFEVASNLLGDFDGYGFQGRCDSRALGPGHIHE
jgi:hypothetical protein